MSNVSAFISFFQILNFKKLILREMIRHEDIKGISNSNKLMVKIKKKTVMCGRNIKEFEFKLILKDFNNLEFI